MKRLSWIIVLLTLVVVIGGNGYATIYQITDDDFQDIGASLYDGKIAWAKALPVPGPGGNHRRQIFFWDGSTTKQINPADNNQSENSMTSLYNGTISWAGRYVDNYEIYYWDGNTITQVTNNDTDDIRPSVYDGTIAWSGWDGNDYEIYYWDGSNITQITNNDYNDYRPSLFDGKIAWGGEADGKVSQIYYWDGSIITQVSNGGGSSPSLYNGTIAWYRHTDGAIFYWDGSTITEIAINAGSWTSLFNGTIAWQAGLDYGSEIYYWDGSTIRQITNNDIEDVWPSLHNGSIAWVGFDKDQHWEIYYWDGGSLEYEKVITITSPDGGEELFAGDTYEIAWTSKGDIGSVKIEYSINNGASWIEIAQSTDNDNSYNWEVPQKHSEQCLVRISDVDGDPYDESDGDFSIFDIIAPNAPILVPIGIADNNLLTFDWEVSNDTSYYELEYADNQNFTNSVLITDIGPSEFEISSPLHDGIWYWRVMAVDEAGNESDWSLTGEFIIDTRNHCFKGPEKPVLLSPTNGAIDVSLTPVLEIIEPTNTADCNYPLESRWRISKDPDFQGLVAKVNSESKDLTRYQPSELILEPNTTYYWKVRFLGSGNNSEWSNVFSFITQLPVDDDTDNDGIPDDQEVDDEDDLDEDGTPDTEQDDEIKSFKTKEGNLKLGMRSSDSNIICVKALYTESVDDYGNKPDQVLYGLWSYRIEVEQYGATATIKMFLSEPAPENAKVVFYDALDGWQDFSDHAVFNDTRTQITLEVKDGGYGDNDHTENKIIVDPSGIGIYNDSSSSGNGCFINSIVPW